MWYYLNKTSCDSGITPHTGIPNISLISSTLNISSFSTLSGLYLVIKRLCCTGSLFSNALWDLLNNKRIRFIKYLKWLWVINNIYLLIKPIILSESLTDDNSGLVQITALSANNIAWYAPDSIPAGLSQRIKSHCFLRSFNTCCTPSSVKAVLSFVCDAAKSNKLLFLLS